MTKQLDIAGNIAVILAVLVFGTLILRDRVFTSKRPTRAAELKVGDRIEPLSGYDWSKYPLTLVLALRPDCPYCEKSVPFYRRLALQEKQNQLAIHLLAVVSSDEAKTRQYAESRKLAIQFHSDTDLAKIKVQGTPTLVLIDQTGHVRKAWVGQLTPTEETEVLAQVGR